MKIDEKRILELADKLNSAMKSKKFPKGIGGKAIFGEEIEKDLRELKELLGGSRLNDIFDSSTIEGLLEDVINTGKIHELLPDGNGLDILECLLNGQVIGDLSEFYIIKSSYILGLSPEQRKNMADSISAGRQDLSIALQNLWNKGIRTKACTTKASDNIPMIMFSVGEDEIESQSVIQQLYEQQGIVNSISNYNSETGEFELNLKGESLYEYLQTKDIPVAEAKKDNIFEAAVIEALTFWQELYDYYLQNDQDTTKASQALQKCKRILADLRARNKQSEKANPWQLNVGEMAIFKMEEAKLYTTDENTPKQLNENFEQEI